MRWYTSPSRAFTGLPIRLTCPVVLDTLPLVARLDAGESVPTRPIDDVPQDSYFDVPTLGQFLRYRRVQASVR